MAGDVKVLPLRMEAEQIERLDKDSIRELQRLLRALDTERRMAGPARPHDALAHALTGPRAAQPRLFATFLHATRMINSTSYIALSGQEKEHLGALETVDTASGAG